MAGAMVLTLGSFATFRMHICVVSQLDRASARLNLLEEPGDRFEPDFSFFSPHC